VSAPEGAEFLASAANNAEEHLGPRHLESTAEKSWQARHTRMLWACSQLSGGAESADRWTERRWEIKDCRKPHLVGEAPSRLAHRGMGQNHMPDG